MVAIVYKHPEVEPMVRPSKYLIPAVAALLFLCSPRGLGHDPNLTVILEFNEILEKDPDHLETLLPAWIQISHR